VARLIVKTDKLARAGTWQRLVGVDVWQKTLGIVGLGRIGKGMAQRASGFEMRVVAYEPFPDLEFCKRFGVELVSLEDVFRLGDFVTVHAPGEGGNHQLVNAERLNLMKPTAILINTARGVLVDEDALYQALTSGKIAGAGLDVRVHEPPQDDRFEKLDNVVLTPHIAGSSQEAQAASADMAVQTVLQFGRGEQPHGLVNPEVWGHLR
jgi:D-3-phosphoglycerate dehydrogenase / 2-oxoglutarate reductase